MAATAEYTTADPPKTQMETGTKTLEDQSAAPPAETHEQEVEHNDDEDENATPDQSTRQIECASCLREFKQRRYLAEHVRRQNCSKVTNGYQCVRCGRSGCENWLMTHEIKHHRNEILGNYRFVVKKNSSTQ